jgi:hypothetical protein
MLLPQTEPVLTFSRFFKLRLLEQLLLLDMLAAEAFEEDRCEDLLRTEAPLWLLEELRVLAELLELRQLAELRDEYTEDIVVRETSVRAESREHTSLRLSFVCTEPVVASDNASSSGVALQSGTVACPSSGPALRLGTGA